MKKCVHALPVWKRLLRKYLLVSTVLSVLFLPSCGTPRLLPSSTIQTDTLIIREVVRDTSVVVQRDSSLIRALVECDSLGQARIRELIDIKAGQHIKPPQLAIGPQNVLTVTALVDSFSVYMKLKDRYQEAVYKTVITPPPIEVNRLTWWQQLWVAMGKIFAAAIAMFAIRVGIKAYAKR